MRERGERASVQACPHFSIQKINARPHKSSNVWKCNAVWKQTSLSDKIRFLSVSMSSGEEEKRRKIRRKKCKRFRYAQKHPQCLQHLWRHCTNALFMRPFAAGEMYKCLCSCFLFFFPPYFPLALCTTRHPQCSSWLQHPISHCSTALLCQPPGPLIRSSSLLHVSALFLCDSLRISVRKRKLRNKMLVGQNTLLI